MRKFFLSFILIASLNVSAEAATEEPLKDISLSYTFVLNSPDSQFSTLNLWAQRWMITLDGKEYLPYDGYYENDNIVDSMFLLRKDGMKYFCYDSNTSKEQLLFDFSLQKGSTYTDDYNNMVYDVTEVRDSIIGDESLRLIELVDQNGKHDIWLEGIGSIYTGIMRGAYVSPGDVYLIRAGSNRFYPSNQYVKTADICVTKLYWNGNLDTEEDRMKYEAWYSAPSDLNAEFIDDTLHVWGRLHISRDILPYAICGVKDKQITFKVHSNGEIDSYANYDIEARIPGFRKDNYEVILYNKTLIMECKGANATSAKRITSPSQKNDIYDLCGRKIGSGKSFPLKGVMGSGIYIEGGKKKVK